MEKVRFTDEMIPVDAVPGMVWVADSDGRRTYFNSSWLEFTGRTMQQELGDGWTAGVHPDDLQQCLDTYRSSIQSRIPFKMEYRLRRANGEYRWVLSHGKPRFGEEGALRGYVGSCLDISDQKSSDGASARLAAIV